MRIAVLLAALATLFAAPVLAQTPEWREVPADNLLVIESTRGRFLIEMYPEAAPTHVERIRALARAGFYDGIVFHRVMSGFMAQTGDPTGTGEGGSDLPDMTAEFSFRRGATPPFAEVSGANAAAVRDSGGVMGLFGALPIRTQPDGQMFVTRDGRVDATAWFCQGVVGAARTASDRNSANSQFFIMSAANSNLNGEYTVWGRVLDGLDNLMLFRSGASGSGIVPEAERERMTRVRVASDIDASERPVVRVLDPRAPRFQTLVEQQRAQRGNGLSICDITLPTEVDN